MIKKFISKEEKEKKRIKNQRILGIVLTIVMFGSVFGVIAGSFNSKNAKEDKIIFNGIEVIKQGSFYIIKIDNKDFTFSENPTELKEFSSLINITKTIPVLVGKPFYIDSIDYYVTQELYQNIHGYPERIQMACLNESDCVDESLPIKDCSNNFIIIRESEESKVYENQSCIFIEGKKEDLIKLTDAFLLKILGLN